MSIYVHIYNFTHSIFNHFNSILYLFYRNRDNARRTRKRKKLYVKFIDETLKALESVLECGMYE